MKWEPDFDLQCVISLQYQKYKHKTLSAHQPHWDQQKGEICPQKVRRDHMASLFTPLRTFLCYMDFLELSKYGAEFSFRLLSNIYIFFFISDISSFNPRKTLRLQRKLCFLLDSYFMLSAIQFCQFLFMSSLCKLSFHPEMEFSFMLKLLLSFCHLVSYRLLL